MLDLLAPPHAAWAAALVAILLGTALIAAAAEIAARRIAQAAWQRAVWQAAVVAMLGLGLAELTGASRALVVSWWPHAAAPELDEAWRGPPSRDAGTSSGPSSGPARPLTFQSLADRAEPQPSEPEPSIRPGLRPNLEADWPAVAEPWTELSDEESVRELARPARTELSSRRLAAPAEPVEGQTAHTLPPEPRSASLRAGPTAAPWWPAVAWGVGAGVVFLRLLGARVVRAVHAQRTEEAGRGLHRRVARLIVALGLRRRVCVRRAPALRAPMVYGTLRPTVVVPTDFEEQFTPAEQEAILAHELGHLAGGDPAWKTFSDFLIAVLWWHPGAWLARRRLEAACEAAADEASLLVHDGPDVLAACLVTLGRRLAAPGMAAGLSIEGLGFRSGLGRRVERLLRLRGRPWRRKTGFFALAPSAGGAVLLVAAVLCTAWAHARADLFDEGEQSMSVIERSWRKSLAAAAVATLLVPLSGDSATADPPRVAAVELQLAWAGDEEGEREGPRDRGDRDRPRREGERDRDEGDRPREGDRDRPDRERGEREGDRERPERERGEREGDRPRNADRERPEREGPPRDFPPRERIEQRLDKLRGAMHRAAEAGREEEANRLEREIHELERMLEHGPPHRPHHPEDMERRMRHVREAAENLHAAGLHEHAERLMREAEQMMHRMREGRPPHPEAGRRPKPDRPFPPGGEIERLRDEVEELRHQIRELREVLGDLLERREKDKDDED